MSRTLVRLGVALTAALTLAACESAKSANPLSPTVAGPIPGVEITAPKLLEPAQGWEVQADKQPITLLIENSSSSGVRPVTYLVEIASDAGFQTIVFTRDGVTPGTNGRTSLKLPDALATGRTYFWRARAQDGANTSAYAAMVSFNVLKPVSIKAPGLKSPVNGVTVTRNPPTMVFANSERSGPAGAISYTLQVSKNEAFTALVYQETDGEQSGETRVTPPTPLEDSMRFYWRVKASDGTFQSDWSKTGSFVTPADAPTPPPPTGGGGGGGGGNGGSCASSDGNFIVDCISVKYASYRRAGVSSSQRRSNMEFLRDRIIEAALCGGLDVGWNLKRGGPEISVDFITERTGGRVVGHDIAMDYDNTGRELRLYWGGGTFPFFTPYTRKYSCN